MQSQFHIASGARSFAPPPTSSGPRMRVVLAVAVVLLASVAVGVVGTSFTATQNRSGTMDRGVTHARSIEGARVERATRLEREAGWLKGLSTGMILPSDVTGRLMQQDPQLARAVMLAERVASNDLQG
jgi:hypothetical protein